VFTLRFSYLLILRNSFCFSWRPKTSRFHYDTHKKGIPLTEKDPQEDEDFDELDVNQRNGFDAFEGDIMMTAEQWEEMKRDFKRTGQPVP